MGFYLSFEAVSGPVDAWLDFTVRKMSSFDVRSSDVRLTWNLTGSLLESFWDDPLALIWVQWSRGASPPIGLILLRSIKTGSNVVGMTWNLTCSLWKHVEATHVLCLMSGSMGGFHRREAWFRLSRVDGGSNGVGLTWNSTWSLLDVFWDHP